MLETNFRALCAELHEALEKRCETLEEDRLLDRSAAALRAALAQPEPVATDEELEGLAEVMNVSGNPVPAMRRALELWGTPTIQPEPVSERLPGAEELATLVPLMHSGASLCHSEGFYEESDAIGRIADFLEQLMPQAGEAANV